MCNAKIGFPKWFETLKDGVKLLIDRGSLLSSPAISLTSTLALRELLPLFCSLSNKVLLFSTMQFLLLSFTAICVAFGKAAADTIADLPPCGVSYVCAILLT